MVTVRFLLCVNVYMLVFRYGMRLLYDMCLHICLMVAVSPQLCVNYKCASSDRPMCVITVCHHICVNG